MGCKHTHKDAPENAVCEDCVKIIKDGAIAYAKLVDDDVYKRLTEEENAKDKL